jgi:hypothetical protein
MVIRHYKPQPDIPIPLSLLWHGGCYEKNCIYIRHFVEYQARHKNMGDIPTDYSRYKSLGARFSNDLITNPEAKSAQH